MQPIRQAPTLIPHTVCMCFAPSHISCAITMGFSLSYDLQAYMHTGPHHNLGAACTLSQPPPPVLSTLSLEHEHSLVPRLLLSTEAASIMSTYTYVVTPSVVSKPCCWLHHCLAHGLQVGAEIVLGDRDQRMTMQRMTALASQYRRKAIRQPDGQQLVPRHSSSQQGGLAQSAAVCLVVHSCICLQLLLDAKSNSVGCVFLACCFAHSLSRRF